MSLLDSSINQFKNLNNKATVGILLLSIVCSLFTFISSFWISNQSSNQSADQSANQGNDDQNTQRLFVLTPNSLVFQPFNLVLSSLVHISIPVGALFLTIFYFASSYFEQQWGKRELIKHFLVVNIITNLLICFILIFKFAITGSSDLLFTKIYGLGPFISALLVAYKRAIPEHSITFQPFFSLRVKYIPSINIAVHFFFFLMGWISTLFYLVTIGSIVSWVYIRYYKYHDGIMGDRSETFSFASFFPDSFIGVIKPISTIVYTTLVNVKLLPPLPPKRPPQSLQSLEEGNDETIQKQQEPVPRPITEETIFETHIQSEKARRKELAERALAERLQQKKIKS